MKKVHICRKLHTFGDTTKNLTAVYIFDAPCVTFLDTLETLAAATAFVLVAIEVIYNLSLHYNH